MFAKSVTGSLLVLLALIVFFYGLRVLTQVYPVGQELLKWDRLLLMGAGYALGTLLRAGEQVVLTTTGA